MMVTSIAPVIASAVIFTLAGQCTRNILQTMEVRNQLAMPNPLLQDSATATKIVNNLKTMNRKELLEVFCNARAPTPSELGEWFSCESDDEYSEWDGTLLENNGKIMTGVSNFFSHQLFGGRLLPWSKTKGRWSGKAFKPTGTGVNRFSTKSNDDDDGTTFFRHKVDYNLQNSKVLKGEDNPVLRLDYANYQSLPISLWWSMHDELRVVHSDGQIVMIGMGWMDWSGGPLNCSPFVLVKR